MTQMIQGESVTETTPALTVEKRAKVQELLAELVLLSAAAVAVQRSSLNEGERERRLLPILARREQVTSLLFG